MTDAPQKSEIPTRQKAETSASPKAVISTPGSADNAKNATAPRPRTLPSVAALAFLGDAVHTRFVRRELVGQGISHAKDLNREALRFVTAPMQERAYLAVRGRLTEGEADVFRRAFNLSHINRPRNVSGETYRTATGYEAVLGMLDYLGDEERLRDLLLAGFEACR